MNPVLPYLKERLEIILEPYLGYYEDDLKNRYGAVRILGNLIPPDWTRRGLLVNILEKPEGDDTPVTRGRFQPYWWVINIDQINPMEGTREVAEAIRQEFAVVKEIHQPQTRETFERSTFKIYLPNIKAAF